MQSTYGSDSFFETENEIAENEILISDASNFSTFKFELVPVEHINTYPEIYDDLSTQWLPVKNIYTINGNPNLITQYNSMITDKTGVNMNFLSFKIYIK